MGTGLPSGWGIMAVPAAGTCAGVKYGTLGAGTLTNEEAIAGVVVEIVVRVAVIVRIGLKTAICIVLALYTLQHCSEIRTLYP